MLRLLCRSEFRVGGLVAEGASRLGPLDDFTLNAVEP